MEKKTNNKQATLNAAPKKAQQPPPVPPWKLTTVGSVKHEDILSSGSPKKAPVANPPVKDPPPKVDSKPSVVNDFKKYKVRRVGIMSVGKIYAIFGFFIGIIAAISFAVTGSNVFKTPTGSSINIQNAVSSSVFNSFEVLFLLIIPFIIAIVYFIFGALGAIILNITLKITRGLEFEMEEQ